MLPPEAIIKLPALQWRPESGYAIAELRPNMSNIEIEGIILESFQPTSDYNQADFYSFQLADQSGSVIFWLVGNMGRRFSVGETVKIMGGWTRSYKNTISVYLKKDTGRIIRTGKFRMLFSKTPNMSEIEWFQDPKSKQYVALEIGSFRKHNLKELSNRSVSPQPAQPAAQPPPPAQPPNPAFTVMPIQPMMPMQPQMFPPAQDLNQQVQFLVQMLSTAPHLLQDPEVQTIQAQLIPLVQQTLINPTLPPDPKIPQLIQQLSMKLTSGQPFMPPPMPFHAPFAPSFPQMPQMPPVQQQQNFGGPEKRGYNQQQQQQPQPQRSFQPNKKSRTDS